MGIWGRVCGARQQQLMLEYQGLCGDNAYTTWAKTFHERNDQVNSEDGEIAHGANATTANFVRKTAQKA